MEKKIKEYLAALEQEKGITILLACETGSRAWGFPSPDSDFDVRVIYKHERDWYLSLSEEKDSIELFLENNEIDISGWDIRKSLRLLWKSNPPLLERIQSPIIYKADENFLKEFTLLANTTYSRIATIHHYLSMAKKVLEKVIAAPEYKLKDLFYALRASVACLWILERKELPPIEFRKMLNGLELPTPLTTRISELIKLKSTISEAYLHKGELDLIEFMHQCIQKADLDSKNLPNAEKQMDKMNEFFRKTIG